MYDAHSLKSITDKVSSVLPRKVVYTKKEPIESTEMNATIGLMTSRLMTTMDMNQPIRYQTVQIKDTRNSKLVGILFAHPKTALAQSEIINHLNHFHVRSGEAADFFCVGYGAYWPEDHYADQSPVVKIEDVDWLFSELAFSKVIDELEEETNWQYSGETELLLISAIRDESGQTVLNYSNAIVCNLEAMAKDGAFSSVRAFFTDIFRYAKKHSASDPAWGLSDNKGITIGRSALKDAVLSLLPKSLKESYKKAEHYAVRDLSQ